MRNVPLLIVLLLAACALGCQPKATTLFTDDFRHGLGNWFVELEKGGTVEAKSGVLEIDVPGGCTVWLKPILTGPVIIEYEATAISAGGPNDRVSDLNCFWMATDSRSPNDLFATQRSGKFADYDRLFTYYVGLGGNNNTTTRFRRYTGEQDNRPLLPEHDLSGPEHLLVSNRPNHIRLVAANGLIEFFRDGKKLFELNDADPYRKGHFAIRTVTSHLRIRNFRVLQPARRPVEDHANFID